MLKLLKYEFRKTLSLKLILLALMGVLEIFYLFGLYAEKDSALTLSVALLTMLSIFGVLGVGLQSIITLHRDMNSRQGYMLFMTPHTSYAILGAKSLECFLSIMLYGCFCAALGTLDITLLFNKYGSARDYLDFLNELLHEVNESIQLTPANVLSLSFSFVCSWLCTIQTAFFADITASALLRGRKFGGLIAFILFIALSILINYVTGLIPAMEIVRYMLLSGCVSLLLAAVMYIPSAVLMERKLSV